MLSNAVETSFFIKKFESRLIAIAIAALSNTAPPSACNAERTQLLSNTPLCLSATRPGPDTQLVPKDNTLLVIRALVIHLAATVLLRIEDR